MNPGTLDRLIQIQRQLDGLPMVTADGTVMTTGDGTIMITGTRQDDLGDEVEAWGLWQRAYAKKVEARGSEAQANNRESGKQPVIFRIRWRSGIELTDRIVYEGRAYDIESAIEIGRRHMLELNCVKHLTPETVV